MIPGNAINGSGEWTKQKIIKNSRLVPCAAVKLIKETFSNSIFQVGAFSFIILHRKRKRTFCGNYSGHLEQFNRLRWWEKFLWNEDLHLDEVLSQCLNKLRIIFHTFRWFVIYRRINAKVLALWRWPIMMRLLSLFNHWMDTLSAIEFCKWASKPTRQRLHKMSRAPARCQLKRNVTNHWKTSSFWTKIYLRKRSRFFIILFLV